MNPQIITGGHLKLNLQLFAAGDPIDLTLEEALSGDDLLVYSRNLETSNEYISPILFRRVK